MKSIFKNVIILFLVITSTSCSKSLITPSILSYKEIITKKDGVKVSGFSTSFFGSKSSKIAIKEATQNALNVAGAEYDALINVEIKVIYKIFGVKYLVSGNAIKYEDIQ